MITVRLYGLLRLDSKIREKQLEAESVKAVFEELTALGIDKASLDGCLVLVNGRAVSKKAKLKDGDTVQLMPPVAGG